MTCDTFFSQLTALLDGELSPEAAAEAERHLAACRECAQEWAVIAEMRGMTNIWTVDAPDITERVLSAVAADDQQRLLEEMQRLRAEMQELRAEVSALRRQLAARSEMSWMPPARTKDSRIVYSRMETDPWNLTRS